MSSLYGFQDKKVSRGTTGGRCARPGVQQLPVFTSEPGSPRKRPPRPCRQPPHPPAPQPMRPSQLPRLSGPTSPPLLPAGAASLRQEPLPRPLPSVCGKPSFLSLRVTHQTRLKFWTPPCAFGSFSSGAAFNNLSLVPSLSLWGPLSRSKRNLRNPLLRPAGSPPSV